MKDPVRIVQEAGWTQGPVWTGAENLNLISACIAEFKFNIRSQLCFWAREKLYQEGYSTHGAEQRFVQKFRIISASDERNWKIYAESVGSYKNT